MESSARTEKKDLLRWWWLRSTRKGFEGEECHCCCLEFVEFTIKNGTSPLDWSSTSLYTPLNLPFTSIKALIATSVILFLSYHTYTHIHINLSCQSWNSFCFHRVTDLGNNKTSNQSNGTTKKILQTEGDPELQIRFVAFPKILNPSFDRFRY